MQSLEIEFGISGSHQSLQGAEHLGRVFETIVWVILGGLHDHIIQAWEDSRVERPHRGFLEGEGFRQPGVSEGKQVMQGSTQGINITERVDIALILLWRGVAGGPDCQAFLQMFVFGQVRFKETRWIGARQSKIYQHDFVHRIEHDVAGFHVPEDDGVQGMGVQVVQDFAKLDGPQDDFDGW